MTYQTYQPNDTKGWTTWLARFVGLVEILVGAGIILLGLATIIAGIIDLGEPLGGINPYIISPSKKDL